MAKDVLHVVPHGEGWAVKREGNERYSTTHDTQKNAIEGARSLAKEGDDIVIHRADGSIRERIGHNGSAGHGESEPARPEAHDLYPVNTRVRWSAIAAGVVVAMAVSALLTAFATAIGLSVVDSVRRDVVTWTAGIVWLFIMAISMFCGGFIATRTTTRETKFEAVVFGTLVWGTMLAIAVAGFGAGMGLALDATRTAKVVSANEPFWNKSNWTDAQLKTYDSLSAAERGNPDTVRERLNFSAEQARQYDNDSQAANQTVANAHTIAWLVFGAMMLGLLASIGGALAGAGPEVTRTIFSRQLFMSDTPQRTQETVSA